MKRVFSTIESFFMRYLSIVLKYIQPSYLYEIYLQNAYIIPRIRIYIYNIASTIAPAESQIPVRESSFIVHRDSALEFGREESLQRGKWLERGMESRSNPTEVVPRSSVRNSWGRKLQNWHRRRYVETDNRRRCLTQWEATGLAVSLYTAV